MLEYKLSQKILHDIIFSNKYLNKSLFEIEKFFYLKNNKIKFNKHIFITGLPRSGTTSILNYLYSSDKFASLTYKNMPFLLSPNISKKINIKDIPPKERYHKDGIKYDLNSPEAFDEVFFRYGEDFILEELENYVNLILISKDKNRYLSKNNLLYKRINQISSIFPESIFLIPIRDPVHQSYSLLCQHKLFSSLQKKNNFMIRYMNYLGHNEFGLNHKSWNDPVKFKDTNNINYWIEQWVLFYQNIIENYCNSKNCYFVIYEKLINKKYLTDLINKIDLNINNISSLNNFKNSNTKRSEFKINKSIFKKSMKIYDQFINQ